MDDRLDRAIADAAPRAPAGFAARVQARLRRRQRTRRAAMGVGTLLSAAAALVLWLLARPAPPPAESGWIANGRALPVGATVRGTAMLVRQTARGVERVRADQDAELRAVDGALVLEGGGVRLEGPEARVVGNGTAVTALGEGAEVAVESRRTTMSNKTNAALTALLAVTVYSGGARVEAQGHAPILLAPHDRTLVARGLPPLTTRAVVADATPKPAPRPAAKPTPKPVPKTAKTPQPRPAATPATDPGVLDKDVIRQVIRGQIDGVRDCYEAALTKDPNLGGRFVVRMTVVTQDGAGRVKEAEIVPSDESYLDSVSMQQCVLQVMSQLEFPAPVGGGDVIIDYPFVFSN